MSLDPRFAESWINERHTVLGYELRPFCLYYRLLFEVTSSPFLTGEKVGIVELYAAVQMCRMSFGDWIRPQRMGLFLKLRLAFLARRYDLAAESAKLDAYLADFFSPPEFWQKEQSESSHGLPPETVSLAAQIINATGWDDGKVWMMPLGQVYWYSAMFARQAGVELRFVSETAEELAAVRKAIATYQADKARRKEEELKASA